MKRLIGPILLSVGLATACAGTSEYTVRGTPKAANAAGTLQIEEIEGGNSLLTLKLKHLPAPQRIGNGLQSYVAWVLPRQGEPVNAGALTFDETSHEGSLMATTALDRFVFRVTAEGDAQPTTPSNIVIAEQHVIAN